MYITANNKRYFITEMLTVGSKMYDTFRAAQIKRQDLTPIKAEESNLLLLTVSETKDEAIITDFSLLGVDRASIIVPLVKGQIERHVSEMAEFCVNQGLERSADGNWGVAFYELANKFDNTVVRQRNALGMRLFEKIKATQGIKDILVTEDCLEFNFEPEFFKAHKIEKASNPLRISDLLKCNLSDIHLCHMDVDHELATICELNAKTLTDEGKEAWKDVLNARVTSIYEGAYGLQIGVTDCKPSRIRDFSYMLAGNCSEQDYNRWVNDENNQTNIDRQNLGQLGGM